MGKYKSENAIQELGIKLGQVHGRLITDFVVEMQTNLEKEHKAEISTLKERIEELENPWVSVKEKFPIDIGCYLVFLKNCKICMAFLNTDNGWCEMWGQKFLDVKYWQKLPPSPAINQKQGG